MFLFGIIGADIAMAHRTVGLIFILIAIIAGVFGLYKLSQDGKINKL